MPDMFLVGVASVLMLLGIVGCLLPALPGPPLAYAGLLALHVTQRYELPGRLLLAGLVLVVVVMAADFFLPAKFTTVCGGTRWGGVGVCDRRGGGHIRIVPDSAGGAGGRTFHWRGDW